MLKDRSAGKLEGREVFVTRGYSMSWLWTGSTEEGVLTSHISSQVLKRSQQQEILLPSLEQPQVSRSAHDAHIAHMP